MDLAGCPYGRLRRLCPTSAAVIPTKPAKAPAVPTVAVVAELPVAKPAAKAATKPVLDSTERNRLISEIAYYNAEKRQFAAGNDFADWLAAERELDARLAKG